MIIYPSRCVVDVFVRADLFTGWLQHRAAQPFYSAVRSFNKRCVAIEKELLLVLGARIVAEDGTVLAYYFRERDLVVFWNNAIGKSAIGVARPAHPLVERSIPADEREGSILSLRKLQETYRHRNALLLLLTTTPKVSHAGKRSSETRSDGSGTGSETASGNAAPRRGKQRPAKSDGAAPSGKRPALGVRVSAAETASRSAHNSGRVRSSIRCSNCGKHIGPRNLTTIGGCEKCAPVKP